MSERPWTVDLWDAGEVIYEVQLTDAPSLHEWGERAETVFMGAATTAVARALIQANEEANAETGRASDAEAHVTDPDGEIVFAAINHVQTAEANYTVEVIE